MKPLVFDQLRKVKHEDRDMMAEDQAQEVSGHQLMGTRMDAMQGDTASAAEKGADFDGGGFLGDGTKIQPAINQIWKVGHLIKRAAYSTYDIEDMDATYQSRLNPSTKDDRATDAGTRDNSTGRRSPDIPIDVAHTDQSHLNPINPGGVGGGDGLQMTSDVPVRGSGVGTGEMEDNPVTEVEPQEPQDERVRIARGLKKRAAVASAWVRAQTSPSRQKLAQALLKRAYKLEGKMDFQGLPIALEYTAGGVRSGIGKDGKPWETHFRYAYGYIDGTKGADGEGLDVFIGPNINADTAFVVHQKKPETGKYDEQKVMLGFDTIEEAKDAYLDHYDSPKFFGGIKAITMDHLRDLVKSKKTLVKISGLLKKASFHQSFPYGLSSHSKVSAYLSQATSSFEHLECLLAVKLAHSRRAGAVPPSTESSVYGSLTNFEKRSNASDRRATLSHKENSVQIPFHRSSMKTAMCRLTNQFKVIDEVVEPVAITVVHDLFSKQGSAKGFLHNNPVFKTLPTIDIDEPVLSSTTKLSNVSSGVLHETEHDSSSIRKQAYDVFDADPATLGSDGPPVHFKMPGKVKTSDGDGVPGRLQSAAQALVEPLEPLPTTNPLTEAKREVSDVRKASSLVRKILNNQPLI